METQPMQFRVSEADYTIQSFIQDRDKLNAGSGQRPFDTAKGWINLDISDKHNPDVIADWNNLSMFADESMSVVVNHHSIEHVGCGEGDGFIREAYRVLKPGGSLIVAVPDLRALCQRFLTGQIDDFTMCVNLHGAFMGEESDRHKWSYTNASLRATLRKCASWSVVRHFDWRVIDGADIARDWWILCLEAVK